MCRETVVQWWCGHHIRTFKACREAIPRSGKKPVVSGEKEKRLYAEAVVPPETVSTGNHIFRPCLNDFQSHMAVDPDEIPFCYRRCVPDYWTCCKCQILTPFGAQSDKENGKRQISSKGRLRRLAPSFTIANSEGRLQTTDVCGESPDEELGEGEDIVFDDSILPCDDVICGCRPGDDVVEEKEGNDEDDNDTTPEISLSELNDILEEMDDTVAPLPGDIPELLAPDNPGCGHLRCKKCLTWRRCPCKCMCPHIIPSTRHHCTVCVRSGCDAIERNNLRATIEAKQLSEWAQQFKAYIV